MGIQPGPEVPLLIAFDDGIGGTVDGARVLLSTAIEDDDTPGKLLYHYPPASALEKVYFMLGFVIQVPKLMSELHGATFPSMSKLLGAQRRLACAGVLHSRLGKQCCARGVPSQLLKYVVSTELGDTVGAVCTRHRLAADDRARLERRPKISLTLDHMRLAISYTQGVTWVLGADLGVTQETLAAGLDTIVKGVSFLEGAQREILKRCQYRRDAYVRAVANAATLMAPLALQSGPAQTFRCCHPTSYIDHLHGSGEAWSDALVTASELLCMVEGQTGAIGGCVAYFDGGSSVSSALSCILTTLSTDITKWVLSIAEGVHKWNYSATLIAQRDVYCNWSQLSDLLENLPLLRRRMFQHLRANNVGTDRSQLFPMVMVLIAYNNVIIACVTPRRPQWLRHQCKGVLGLQLVDLVDKLVDSVLLHRKRAKTGIDTRTDQAWLGVNGSSNADAVQFKGAGDASVSVSSRQPHNSVRNLATQLCAMYGDL